MHNEATNRYFSPVQTLTPIYIDAGLFATLQKEGRVAEQIAINSRAAEQSLLESCVSIATVNHSPPAYQPRAEATSSVVNSVVSHTKRATVFERIALDFEVRFSKADLKLKVEKATNEFLDAMAPDSKIDATTAVNRFETNMQEISVSMDKFKESKLSSELKKEIAVLLKKMTAEKFEDSGPSVNSASVEKVRAILELAHRTNVGQPESAGVAICQAIASQTLSLFQAQLFSNLKIETKKITNDLLAGAEPKSKISISDASKVFERKMKAISEHREHLKDHDLFEDFAKKINESSNAEATEIYYADKKNNNIADWKAKSKKLAEGSAVPVDIQYSKDIQTAKGILRSQLRWMKEKDFSNQIKASIKEVFPKRYELVIFENCSSAQDVTDETKRIIGNFKQCLINNCKEQNEKAIAEKIQSKRKGLAELLKVGDDTKLTLHTGSNKSLTIAINKYLEDNETELDLAVSSLFIDHIKNMLQSGRLVGD